MVMLVFTVVALFVTGAHVLLVLSPVVSQPANTPLNEPPPPPPPDGRIVIVRLLLPTPTELEAEMVTTFVPAVGLGPDINPFVVLMLAQPGKFVAPKEVGAFDAVI